MAQGQRRDVPRFDRTPAIMRNAIDNPVVAVNQKLKDGTIRLALDGRGGYLQSALQALDIPVDSQMLVFSPTSLQARLINPDNPRALFFNDRVVLGYVRNGEILEVAAQDATAGIVFYTLEQKATDPPQFQRVTTCLGCHLNADTLGVPGLLSSTLAHLKNPTATRSVAMIIGWRSDQFRWVVQIGSSGGSKHIGAGWVPALGGHPAASIASVLRTETASRP